MDASSTEQGIRKFQAELGFGLQAQEPQASQHEYNDAEVAGCLSCHTHDIQSARS